MFKRFTEAMSCHCGSGNFAAKTTATAGFPPDQFTAIHVSDGATVTLTSPTSMPLLKSDVFEYDKPSEALPEEILEFHVTYPSKASKHCQGAV